MDDAGVVLVCGLRAYKEVVCTGCAGHFQRQNLDGVWQLCEDLVDELPQYSHEAPNGESLSLFHATYGNSPRWVIGSAERAENGWAFCDTEATRPEDIMDQWTVWEGATWEKSRRLHFRGKESDNDVYDDDDNEDDDVEDELPKGGKAAKPKQLPKEEKKGEKKGKKGRKRGKGSGVGLAVPARR